MTNTANKYGKLSQITLTKKQKETWYYITCEMLAVVQSQETRLRKPEDKPSTSISTKVCCLCCATIPCWSTFTKNHSKQGHTNIHATLCLPEVSRSRVRVQLWTDFKHSWQRMHNHHPVFCPGHQLWCHYKQSTCLQQKTKMVNMLWNLMVTQQCYWRLRLLGSGDVQ